MSDVQRIRRTRIAGIRRLYRFSFAENGRPNVYHYSRPFRASWAIVGPSRGILAMTELESISGRDRIDTLRDLSVIAACVSVILTLVGLWSGVFGIDGNDDWDITYGGESL